MEIILAGAGNDMLKLPARRTVRALGCACLLTNLAACDDASTSVTDREGPASDCQREVQEEHRAHCSEQYDGCTESPAPLESCESQRDACLAEEVTCEPEENDEALEAACYEERGVCLDAGYHPTACRLYYYACTDVEDGDEDPSMIPALSACFEARDECLATAGTDPDDCEDVAWACADQVGL